MRILPIFLLLSAFAVAYAAPGDLKWKYQTGGFVYSSPAIGPDGTVYFGSNDHYLYAVNSVGTLRWKYGTGDWVSSSPSIDSDSTIYVGSDDGYIYAIKPSGSLGWKNMTWGYVFASPAIGSDSTIYVASSGGVSSHIYAFNPSGSLNWEYRIRGWLESSPAVGPDATIYSGSNDGYLYALNPSGSLKWSFQTEGDVISSPAVGFDGTVYFGSDDYYFYAISPSGTLKWKYETGFCVETSPTIGSDGTIYFGSYDGYLYALNPSGSLKWKYKPDYGVMRYSPAIGLDDIIYVGSIDSFLFAINPSGSLKWKSKIGGNVSSDPAISADGTLYFGASDGCLYAVESSSKGLATSPWPKFHHDNRNTGRYSLGVYATTIVEPQEGSIVHSMIPTAYFTNTNVESAWDFYCHCEISSQGFASVCHDSVFISGPVSAGDSTRIEFAEWVCQDSLSYISRFYATDVFSTTQTVNFNGSPIGVAENPQPPSFSVDVSGLHHGIKVSFTLPEGQSGVLRVFDVTGRRVAQKAVTSSGEVEFKQAFASGVYFVRLEAGARTLVRKVVVRD